MQPNKSWSPWRNVSSVVMFFAVGSAILLGLSLLALLPASGISTGDGLEDHVCITTSRGGEDLYEDDSTFGKASSNGVRSSEVGHMHCKAYDDFDHPYAAHLLAQSDGMPMLIAFVGLMFALRGIINRTWESGPFHVDAVRLLDRFRWWATGAVAVAVAMQWVFKGIELQLLTDEPWPGLGIPWTVIVVWVALTLATTYCETVARRRGDGPSHGQD